MGKITVVKSLAISQLVYIMFSLPTCVDILKEVNNLFFKFIWDGKGDKIKRLILFNEYENGGLKMLDVVTFSKSLKACWLQKYFESTDNAKWKYFLEESLDKLGGNLIFSGFLREEDVNLLDTKNVYHRELIQIWTKLTPKSYWHRTVNKISDIGTDTLFGITQISKYI